MGLVQPTIVKWFVICDLYANAQFDTTYTVMRVYLELIYTCTKFGLFEHNINIYE